MTMMTTTIATETKTNAQCHWIALTRADTHDDFYCVFLCFVFIFVDFVSRRCCVNWIVWARVRMTNACIHTLVQEVNARTMRVFGLLDARYGRLCAEPHLNQLMDSRRPVLKLYICEAWTKEALSSPLESVKALRTSLWSSTSIHSGVYLALFRESLQAHFGRINIWFQNNLLSIHFLPRSLLIYHLICAPTEKLWLCVVSSFIYLNQLVMHLLMKSQTKIILCCTFGLRKIDKHRNSIKSSSVMNGNFENVCITFWVITISVRCSIHEDFATQRQQKMKNKITNFMKCAWIFISKIHLRADTLNVLWLSWKSIDIP